MPYGQCTGPLSAPARYCLRDSLPHWVEGRCLSNDNFQPTLNWPLQLMSIAKLRKFKAACASILILAGAANRRFRAGKLESWALVYANGQATESPPGEMSRASPCTKRTATTTTLARTRCPGCARRLRQRHPKKRRRCRARLKRDACKAPAFEDRNESVVAPSMIRQAPWPRFMSRPGAASRRGALLELP